MKALITGGAGPRSSTGMFLRQRPPWDPSRWDDGYADNKGRFRVYRPDYPRAYGGSSKGYAKRSHVVWWLETGQVLPADHVLHHKNEDKLDDRFENLELKTHGQHTIEHCRKEPVVCLCRGCGRNFGIPQWQLNQGRGHFCSQKCYHANKGKSL